MKKIVVISISLLENLNQHINKKYKKSNNSKYQMKDHKKKREIRAIWVLIIILKMTRYNSIILK